MTTIASPQLVRVQPSQFKPNQWNTVKIFVNGLFNSIEEAKTSARLLALSNASPIYLCYTDTDTDTIDKKMDRVTLEQGVRTVLGALLGINVDYSKFSGELVSRSLLYQFSPQMPVKLAQDIRYWVRRNVRVEVHAHSRGTLVTEAALPYLNQLTLQQRQLISLTYYAPLHLVRPGVVGRFRHIFTHLDPMIISGLKSLGRYRAMSLLAKAEWISTALPNQQYQVRQQAINQFSNEVILGGSDHFNLNEIPAILDSIQVLRWMGTDSHSFRSHLRGHSLSGSIKPFSRAAYKTISSISQTTKVKTS